MIGLAPGTKVFLACHPIDLRAGFDGLSAKVQQIIGADPFSGHLFIFRSKRGHYLKGLYWDGSGLCLFAKLAVQLRTLEIEKLKFQIAKLRRMQFGRSSERLGRRIEQLELRLEELETGEAEAISKAVAEGRPLPTPDGARPKRQPLPDHLPRAEVVHEPEQDGDCSCPQVRRRHGPVGPGCHRGARLSPRPLPGDPARPSEIRLPAL